MWIAAGLLGCSSPAARPIEPAPAPIAIDAGIDAPVPIDAGPAIDEVHARAQLGAVFRAAGLRLRYDVRVVGAGYEFTADGYDPERRIGFEYIAPAEIGTDISGDEPARLAADDRVRILLIGPADARTVAAAADAFAARHLHPDAGVP
jgi:hypothetical protein